MIFSRKRLIFTAAVLAAGFIFLFSGQGRAVLCGDGKVEGIEECDNGTNNSDTRADACRTDCVLPRCGDGVTDTGEECDDFRSGNSDKIPGACRTDCREAHCGDGVLDPEEECDDKNNNSSDGCHACMSCYLPKDNLVLSESYARVRLCQGRYELGDSGQEGVIIVTGYEMIIDCDNAELVGAGVNVSSVGSTKVPSAAAQAVVQPGSSKGRGPGKGRQTPTVTPKDSPQAVTPSGSPPPQPSGSSTVLRQGTGIVIQAPNVALHNCNVENFKTGIRLKSEGAVLFNNRVCGNSRDIDSGNSGNFGARNTCSTQQNWQDNCVEGCSSGCGN